MPDAMCSAEVVTQSAASCVAVRIRRALAAFDAAFAERERESRLVLLTLLAGHHVLLLGPPGTAKSLLARAACEVFAREPAKPAEPQDRAGEVTVAAAKSPPGTAPGSGAGQGGARYFEYLLTRFSHPDELFGPISIPGLKEEDYRRLTDGFLPTAEIAFIDEIFKANSAVLNSLLGIVNERIFHCGRHREAVPLLGLVGASNEPPDPEGGLGALYDRFLVRLEVPPIEAPEAFLRVALGELPPVSLSAGERLTVREVEALRREAAHIEVPPAVRAALVRVREGLREAQIAASDRRWRWAVELLRMAALTAGRRAVAAPEVLLLQHVFGEPGEDAGRVRQVLRRAVEELLAPPPVQELEAAWRALAAPPTEVGGMRALRAERLARLDKVDEAVAVATQALALAREAALEEASASPWLVSEAQGADPDVVARLVAAFMAARQTVEAFRDAARQHREELTGLDLRGEALTRLRRAQARAASADTRARGEEVVVWLAAPGDEPEEWVPVSAQGWLLYEQAPRIAGRIQRRLLDEVLAAGRSLDDTPAWHLTVPHLLLDEDAVWSLLSEWAELQPFLESRGLGAGPTAAALRALSEWLRGAGVPRLPPPPPLPTADAR